MANSSEIIQKYNAPPFSGQRQDNNQLVVYRKFHYIPAIYEKLKKSIQKYNIKLIAIPPPYLIDTVSDKIDKIAMDQKSGIYEIPITLSNNVEKVYIGMTKRKYSVRIVEHRRDIKQRKQNTALSRFYLANEVCYINFDESKIIIPCNNPFESKIRESVEIIAQDNKPSNDNLSYNTPKIWHNIIKS